MGENCPLSRRATAARGVVGGAHGLSSSVQGEGVYLGVAVPHADRHDACERLQAPGSAAQAVSGGRMYIMQHDDTDSADNCLKPMEV